MIRYLSDKEREELGKGGGGYSSETDTPSGNSGGEDLGVERSKKRKQKKSDKKKEREDKYARKLNRARRIAQLGQAAAKIGGQGDLADILGAVGGISGAMGGKKEERAKKLRRVGSKIGGQGDLADILGAVGGISGAIGVEKDEIAEKLRRVESNIVGSEAARFAKGEGVIRKGYEKLAAKKGYKVPKKVGAGGAAAIGGAVSGLLQGEGVVGAGKNAISWYLKYAAFAALFTLVGFFPGLIYLNFHYIASKFGSKIFGSFTLIEKVMYWTANGIGLVLIILVFVIALTPFIALCNLDGIAGAGTTVAKWTGILPSSVCDAFSISKGGNTVESIVPTTSEVCSDPGFLEELAVQNNTPITPQNDPETVALLNCIASAEDHASAIGGFAQNDEQYLSSGGYNIYTFDNDHPTCNITRGDPICDPTGICSHAINSCHYGGSKEFGGRQGALAIDYAVTGNLG